GRPHGSRGPIDLALSTPVDDNGRAAICETTRYCEADTAGRAGHNRGFAGKIDLHGKALMMDATARYFPATGETAGKIFVSAPKSPRPDGKFIVISIPCAKFPTRVGRENIFPAAGCSRELRRPRRDGPENARNRPDGESENQREHAASITCGCGNFGDAKYAAVNPLCRPSIRQLRKRSAFPLPRDGRSTRVCCIIPEILGDAAAQEEQAGPR